MKHPVEAIDIMTVDFNKSHPVSMSSVKSRISLNREASLLAKVCLTFLSTSNSHLILYALRAVSCFLFSIDSSLSKCRQLGDGW